ncbi:helix-turn-helix domain-containing protein [Pararhizobium haloflavum]|uniref:helix-turn-helix domain-containing protein n=1 Tax=Pararhizobium haloflavum TaxID=2037914 RepID=UPI000C199EFC|nr:helix-turn-helix transcriptional regulator [Pararhizobium haloflavum]
MYSHPQQGLDTSEVLRLRQRAGRWVRILRENAGLSQRELAKATGIDYYSFISQIESGRGRIPPERYLAFAEAFGIDPKHFVQELLRYYDPITYDILYSRDPVSPQIGATRARAEQEG